MSTLARFLTRMIVLRFAVILLGLSAFVLTLEVVGFLTDISHIHSNPFAAVGLYCAARLPGIINLFLPTSLLLALLLAITELSYRNELTAIWATGVSPSRLIVKLLPMALAIGLFQFLIMEIAVPSAATSLHSWGIGDYATRKFKTAENEPIWIVLAMTSCALYMFPQMGKPCCKSLFSGANMGANSCKKSSPNLPRRSAVNGC